MNRELPMPAAIQRIAVISSRNAAGYQDFMKEISSSPYGFEITLFDAFMQGAEAEESIVRAWARRPTGGRFRCAGADPRGRFAERSGVLQQLSAVLLPGAVPVAGDRRDRT